MKNLFSIILLLALAGNIVSSTAPFSTKEMSEWNMEMENENEKKELEETDTDIDKVWTNSAFQQNVLNQNHKPQKFNDWEWKDIHRTLVSPPPDA